MQDFIVTDIETANNDAASICQVGFVRFSGGEPVEEWGQLVDPEAEFLFWNIRIHGITPARVAGAPRLSDLEAPLRRWLAGPLPVFSHTYFDRNAFRTAFARRGWEPPAAPWYDSVQVARQAWPQFRKGGASLGNLSRFLGLTFQHHDALEDARAAGWVIVRALETAPALGPRFGL